MALLASTSLSSLVVAQSDLPKEFAFDFEGFSARMQDLAAAPFSPLDFKLPSAFSGLDYDSYRLIQYRDDKSKWLEDANKFRVQAFHLGWLYNEPVKVYEIVNGNAHPIGFSPADFNYHDPAVETAAKGTEFPGVAGFRINHPINSNSAYDELVSFLGASYFRALGRDNIYGLSARGLAINSWVNIPEEFPRFSEFFIEKPDEGGSLTIYAALESPSLTGAYKFVIIPAGDKVQETEVDVTARLFFRTDVQELGVAPLTSMFLFAEANRASFDDYRPQVHDSNGLLIERESGERMWRALNNGTSLGNSYFWESNPRAFGLYQRGREFETYQDPGAHYERRPSLRIEPQGPWGQGMVRLIEIPAKLEADDNMVAFWVPSEAPLAGTSREYNYKMFWGDLDPQDEMPLAYVAETRAGVGGVSGVENEGTLRKFVVDFKGGELAGLPESTPLDVLSAVSGGVVRNTTLFHVPSNGVWRLVLDVEPGGQQPLELKAYVVGLGRALTETWLYQWRPAE